MVWRIIMNNYIYKVYNSKLDLLGTIESLENALIFIKALYNQWYNEPELTFLIKREEMKNDE